MVMTTTEVLGNRIERLKKKVANMQKDVGRYEWLKTKMYCKYGWPDFEYRHWCGIHSNSDNLEKTIDAKMREEKESGNDEEGLRSGG